MPNRNDLYGHKEPVTFAWFLLPVLCCVTSVAWLHKR